MRHVIGYLICLAFVVMALAFLGELSPLTKSSEAHVGAAVQAMETDAGIQASIDPTTPLVDMSSPLHDLGHVVAIVFSPVGAIGLGLYLLVIWILPAR
jgi:hypothetical protein